LSENRGKIQQIKCLKQNSLFPAEFRGFAPGRVSKISFKFIFSVNTALAAVVRTDRRRDGREGGAPAGSRPGGARMMSLVPGPRGADGAQVTPRSGLAQTFDQAPHPLGVRRVGLIPQVGLESFQGEDALPPVHVEPSEVKLGEGVLAPA